MSKKHSRNSHITRRVRRTTFKKHSKHYAKVYSPYLPALLIFTLAVSIWAGFNHNLKNTFVLSAKTELNNEYLLKETNEKRVNGQIQPLKENPSLNAAARNKAIDMAARDYWSHDTPDGKKPWFFIENQQYKYAAAEENLAYGFDSSASVINGWMNSPLHKKAMLNQNVSEVGFGVAKSDNYQGKGPQTIIVAFYAEPAKVTGQLALTNIINNDQKISFAEALTTGKIPFLNLFIGIAMGASLMFIILRHGLKIRKKIKKGEKYIINHPALDVTVVSIIILCVVATETAGFIY